jgi:hypothetical protein
MCECEIRESKAKLLKAEHVVLTSDAIFSAMRRMEDREKPNHVFTNRSSVLVSTISFI